MKLHYRFLIGNFQFDIKKCIQPVELPEISKQQLQHPICQIIKIIADSYDNTCDQKLSSVVTVDSSNVVTVDSSNVVTVNSSTSTNSSNSTNSSTSSNSKTIIIKKSDAKVKETDDMVVVMKDAKITDGFLTQLAGKDQIKWDPFVCKVEKKIFNKISKWWFLIVNDGKSSYRVAVATQCLKVIENIQKDNLIYVEYYTATTIHSKKPKIIIFTKITKIDNKTEN
jgi:hypothetical protein